jgi:chaperonin GroEL
MLVEYDNARVLITDQKLETIKDVMGIMEAASKAGGPLVIIAEDVTVSCHKS